VTMQSFYLQSRDEIPPSVLAVEQMLKMPQTDDEQLDRSMAIIEACIPEIRDWVHMYMGQWEPRDIEYWGNILKSLDDRVTRAGNEFILRGNVQGAKEHLFPAIQTIKYIWNEMVNRGYYV
jgi:hypothetical protein